MLEHLLGACTLQVAQDFVAGDSRIETMHLRAYDYIPNTTSGIGDTRVGISREDFIDGSVIATFIDAHPDSNVALDSQVIFDGGKPGHLPMLDMAQMKSHDELLRVQRRIGEIIMPHYGRGVLLESGRSYHYIGAEVFPAERFYDFLGVSLLSSEVTVTPPEEPNIHNHVVDYRYVGHALRKGHTALRITARGEKSTLPRVVATV